MRKARALKIILVNLTRLPKKIVKEGGMKDLKELGMKIHVPVLVRKVLLGTKSIENVKAVVGVFGKKKPPK
ncbi:MAG: hypothetical protein EGQ14_05800 [Spirochaetia bacterium]|nr:hypothetical protein [Spirochaetia bacterium]